MRWQEFSSDRRPIRATAEGPSEQSARQSSSLASHALQLQRTGGNQSVCQLLAVGQAKLKVGPSQDPLEREADLVARHVVAALDSSGPAVDSDTFAHDAPAVRRRAKVGAAGGAVDAETESLVDDASRQGSPMDAVVQRRFETAFGGADFSAVRLHAGADAAELNDRLSAHAFTLGNDVFFGRGLPALSTPEGQGLLAHELTHTIQQSGGQAARRVRRKEAEHGLAAPTIQGGTGDRTTVQRMRKKKPSEEAGSKPPKGDKLEFEGVVQEALPKAMFRVHADSGTSVLATISRGIRIRFEKIRPGSRVTVEVSPYDPTRGEITYVSA